MTDSATEVDSLEQVPATNPAVAESQVTVVEEPADTATVSTTENTPLSCKDASLAVLKWAVEHNLVDAQIDFGNIQAQAEVPGNGTLFGPGAASTQLLRTKQISGVLFNSRDRCVYVMTRRKLGVTHIKTLPNLIANYELRYLHLGTAQAGIPVTPTDGPGYYEHNGFYACGSSIHPAKYPGAGTMGCLLRAADGGLYGLSNNHVSGLCNYSEEGEKILAPGHIDIHSRSRDPFTIGVHTRALSMVHGLPSNVDVNANQDAAIFAIRVPQQVTSHQGHSYDTPSNIGDIVGGMRVQKVGRTTGLTTGRVVGISPTPIPVNYQIAAVGGNAAAFFNNVAIVEGENGNPFSQAGDSGSLVTSVDDHGNRFAVGLVFAGANGGHSYILPIRPILELLEMELVSGHNT